MEGKQLKLYTYWNMKDKPEIHKLAVSTLSSTLSYVKHLQTAIHEVFPALKGKEYTISWKDDEGDDIVILTDKELEVAAKEMSPVVKFHIYCKQQEAQDPDPDIGTAAESDPVLPCIVNYGVVCDACEAPVAGFRYKCIICDDYDLCSKCEGARYHPEHFMLRVPVSAMPRTLIKAAIKRSRHILKNVASEAAAGHSRCPRPERSSERRRRGAEQQANERRENRRPRTSWFETVATYMNEFANLAGDIHAEAVNKSADTQPQPQTKKTNEASKQAASEPMQTASPPKQAAAAPDQAWAPELTDLDAKLDKCAQLMRQYLHKTLSQQPTNTPQPSTSTGGNDVEVGQGDKASDADRRSSVSDKESVASEDSEASNASSKKEDTPELVDDWTVIKKDKDSLDICMKPSAPVEPEPLKDLQFAGSVYPSKGQSLYPPLNVDTAVLDPKEAEAANAPETPKVSPQTKAQDVKTKKPQTLKQPLNQPHPMPHINAALQQMLNMGFTNDGGWLTQLLENKDGNIAAVLDLLTPVKPKTK